MDRKQTVGELAAERPASVKVFYRHGIDFCCGGGVSLEQACERRGLDAGKLRREIDEEETRGGHDPGAWQSRALDDLIDHILSTYHRPLDEELPRLEQLARKVARVHGERHAELEPLRDAYLELASDLAPHMMKEEQVLFPAIRAANREFAAHPIEAMRMEHETAGDLLARMRELTSDYALPEDACGSFRALYNGLRELERELFEHIHLENNILFPRALRA